MIDMQATKTFLMVPPESNASGAFSTNNILDTEGYNFLRVMVIAGAMAGDLGSGASGDAAIQLEEGDDDGLSDAADITGYNVPKMTSSDDNKIVAIDVPLGGRKRYIRIKAMQVGGTNVVGAIGIMSRAEQSPNTKAKAGLHAWNVAGSAMA